ncbi:LPXTG cell wall anchor domain-containing protein [uncultured Parolsenella sp.]|uniref:LPXTG cell wall anchor domain-containing protein n=1 Tax=uncultured Parolsenella sp. TaxID=2083008 RepID=UPI0027DB7F72|nr:LPXTG cell wall anchor domain-containing protein [uncultured Parolsenella sp.]
MSAAGWAAKQSLVAQAADKTAEKALPATGDDAMLAIAALGVIGATAAATGITIGRHREE